MKEKESEIRRLMAMNDHSFLYASQGKNDEEIELFNKVKAIRALAKFEEFRLHPDKNCIAPPLVLTIGGREVATEGNVSLILGKPKSGKTFLVTAIAAALISDKPILGIIKGHKFGELTKVLLIDTEQTDYHATKVLNRIEKLAGEDATKKNLVAFGFRSLNFEDRRNKLNEILQESKLFSAVIIDGIRDLVSDFNNVEQVNNLKDDLLRWSKTCQTHIFCVLHENKSNQQARGHLGSELGQKCESTLSISKESIGERAFSKVDPEMCRNQDFNAFAFEIKNGLPVLVEDIEFKKSHAPKKTKQALLKELKNPLLSEVFAKVFKTDKKQLRNSLIKNIQAVLDNYNHSFGQKVLADNIDDFVERGFLTRPEVSGGPKSFYKPGPKLAEPRQGETALNTNKSTPNLGNSTQADLTGGLIIPGQYE